MGVKVKSWKGAWYIFVNHQRKRVARRCSSKKAALIAADQIDAKLKLGDLSVLTKKVFTPSIPAFAEVAEEWLQKYPALHAIRPSTLENYRSTTARHLLPFFGSTPITAITPSTIEDFIEAKRASGGSVRWAGKPISDSTLRTYLEPLKMILKRARRRELILANPFDLVEWRSQQRVENADPFASHELRRILEAAPHAVSPAFATMLRLWAQSGMRAGEVYGLQQHDMNYNAGTALVRRTWSRQRLGPTKTNLEREPSFLHPIADDSPEWHPSRSTAAARSLLGMLRALPGQGLLPDVFVFTRPNGKPWSSDTIKRPWRRTLLAAGVRYREPEQLRHTFASTLLSRNAPPVYVQKQGGWRSAGVLLRVYARWMPQDLGPFQLDATPAQPATIHAVK
jgi:integrase